ncbi:MAG: hypothetical protein WC533_04815 [Candidatus Pacearchaeota archaeon]
MGLFWKKKRGDEIETLPALPSSREYPKIPALPKDETEYEEDQEPSDYLPALPKFPKSNLGDEINQNTIKQAINEESEFIESPKPPEQFKKYSAIGSRTKEIEELPSHKTVGSLMIHPNPERRISNFESDGNQKETFQFAQKIRGQEQLFVKLDKFEKAISKFNEIKIKLSELDFTLKGIKELKSSEERELSQWEGELEIIKSNLEKIDQDLFTKV